MIDNDDDALFESNCEDDNDDEDKAKTFFIVR
jgi:hypothetical protein